MFEDIKGKVIFITGAASGMGRETAITFGSFGCKVAVAARKKEAGEETCRLVRDAGGEAVFLCCDVASDESVKNAIEETVRLFGKIDYAFNNAGCGADGVNIPYAPLTEVTEEDWDKVIDTNLKGVFHCLKYELIQMQKQGHGAIVNTSSIGGIKMYANFGAYGPSKSGIIGLTQTAAVENAKLGIRVNAICPGPTVGTNLMTNSIATGHHDVKRVTEQVIPNGRMGTTEDVANTVLFLCSEMSSHITGGVIPVCGGMQM